jgi:hypothetical protein
MKKRKKVVIEIIDDDDDEEIKKESKGKKRKDQEEVLEKQKKKQKIEKDELEDLFEKYISKNEELEESESIMDGDTIIKFFEDLKINMTDETTLILFYELGCKKKYIITKDEFINGFKKLKYDTKDKITKYIPNLIKKINDQEYFKQFYEWCFKFFKNETQKNFNKEGFI